MKKGIIIMGAIVMLAQAVMAQTFVTDTLKQASMSGTYYNNTQIIMGPGFSTLPSGQFLAYILPQGCRPLNSTPSNVNYIITYTPRQPFTSADNLNAKLSCEVMENISYFDGLGRQLQNVQVKGSPFADKDIIQPFEYDNYGREKVKYAPYAAASSNGTYQSAALNVPDGGVYSFYKPTGINVGTEMPNGITSTLKPFAEINYESSPLNRITEKGAPGEAWQLAQGHTVKMDYPNNLANEVRLYKAVYVSGTPTYKRALSPAGYFPANQLLKTITKDENWIIPDGRAGTVHEFKDKEGKVLLKRTFNLKNGQLDSLSTYYVYDESDNLSYVLPPGVKPDETYIINQTDLNTWCYQYRYDDRNRLIEKKIPGKGWEFLVYNKADQLVMSQDSVQRSHVLQDWVITKYDRFNRVVVTGVFKQPGSLSGINYRANMQDSVNMQQRYPNPRWEVKTANGNGYLNASGTYNVFPYTLNAVLTLNYYDNYSVPNIPSLYAAPLNASSMTQNLLTASKVAILTEDYTQGDMLWSVLYYDDKGRNIKTYSQHYLGGVLILNNYDEVVNEFEFSNALSISTRLHHTVAASGAVALTIKNSYLYDQLGRKVQTVEQINQQPPVVLSKIDFNDVGQLLSKSVGDNLQTIKYAYNERGWMVKDSSALFYLRLKYNLPVGSAKPQYNGNISQMNYLTTKVTNPGTRSFNYSYDKINRLTFAAFSGGMSGDALDEQITYDNMGNIQTLSRSGTGAGTLNYSYNGNQLSTVTGYKTRSYLYDGNSNAISDISGNLISYNMLNLPQKLVQNNSLKATYTYQANAEKLRNSGSDGTWDYINGVVYHDNQIAFVISETGRAMRDSTMFNYQYNLTDHLGSTRLSFDRKDNLPRIIQEDEYYSFGLKKPTGEYNLSNNNRFLYNGKELQVDLANQLDYGARFYDPLIARWIVPDPLTDLSTNFSPFTYCNNNPILLVDRTGLFGDTTKMREVKITGASVGRNFERFMMNLTGMGMQKDLFGKVLDYFKVSNTSSNLLDVIRNSNDHRTQTALTGQILQKVKNDPGLIKFRKNLLSYLKTIPKLTKAKFHDRVQFGGKWGEGNNFNVANSELTWTIRNTEVYAEAIVKSDGTILVSYSLSDVLDLTPQETRSIGYNFISTMAGTFYHGVGGGSMDMKVTADWTETIKQ